MLLKMENMIQLVKESVNYFAKNDEIDDTHEDEDADYKTHSFEAGHTIVVTKELCVQLKDETQAQ